MISRRSVCGVAVLATGWRPAFAASELFVIAHASVSITPEDVREIFLGEKQTAGRIKLVPLDNAALHAEFAERALGLSPAKYQSIWARKGFRDGLTPPQVLPGDAEVLRAVRSAPGAVGYVATGSADLKIVQRF